MIRRDVYSRKGTTAVEAVIASRPRRHKSVVGGTLHHNLPLSCAGFFGDDRKASDGCNL